MALTMAHIDLVNEIETRIVVVNIHNLPDMEDGMFCRIDRQTVFGNPFIIGRDGGRNDVVMKYYETFRERYLQNEELRKEFNRLLSYLLKEEDGKLYLGCWCSPQPCHGDVLKRLSAISWINIKSGIKSAPEDIL